MKVFSWSVLSKLCLNVSISFLGGFFFTVMEELIMCQLQLNKTRILIPFCH